MKRMLSFGLVAALALSLVACGSPASESGSEAGTKIREAWSLATRSMHR